MTFGGKLTAYENPKVKQQLSVRKMSADVEAMIEAEDWQNARRVIRRRLLRTPEAHWLLTRMALTFYEERKYTEALDWSEKALSIAPNCPLVLWDYAGALAMLDRFEEAKSIYRKLIRKGPHRIARDECGEGLARARGLVADCQYRLARCYVEEGHVGKARTHLKRHLDLRGPGCHSIYPIDDVRRELKILESCSASSLKASD